MVANRHGVDASLSIVIPTLGRPSLKGVVDCLLQQMGPDDELILVADGVEAAFRVTDLFGSSRHFHIGSNCRHFCHYDEQSAYGNAQRNAGIRAAKKGMIWIVDDDDTVLTNALQTIRNNVIDLQLPHIFQVEHLGTNIPRHWRVELGNVSGQCAVVPNSPNLPLWDVPSSKPEHADCRWVEKVDAWRSCGFVNQVIYKIERHSRGQ